MKNIGIRVALVLTFLLMLGVIFVGINFAPAYAATTSAHLVEPTPPPLPNRVDCGGSPDLIIIADNFTNKDCFRGDGKISVTIYNVTYICVYNNKSATITYYYDNDPADTSKAIGPGNQCIIATDRTINIVKSIDLS
jgi:hypothetical protein